MRAYVRSSKSASEDTRSKQVLSNASLAAFVTTLVRRAWRLTLQHESLAYAPQTWELYHIVYLVVRL